MKWLITLFASVFSLAVFAGFEPSQLHITFGNHRSGQVHVIVDNHRYTDKNADFHINSISPGYHHIKVYSHIYNKRRNDYPNYRLLYSGFVNIRPGYLLEMSVSPNGQARFQEVILRGTSSDPYSNRKIKRFNERRNHIGNRKYAGNRVSSIEFSRIRESLRREDFEDSRVRMARQILEQYHFNTMQVKEMLTLFAFENNRLGLAKHAYRTVSDPGNYYMVNDVFHFTRSRNELNDFIRRSR